MASAAVPTLAPDHQATSRARVVSAIQRQGAFIALAALIIFGAVRYGPGYYSAYNIFDAFLNNNTYYALIALGMTFVIISGGIYLSVGSVAVLAAVAAARLSVYGLGPALAGGVLIGLVAGLINGGLIARFGLQPFVVTRAMLLAARGAALTLSENAPVMVDFAHGFTEFGTLRVGPVPLPVLITAVLYLLGVLLLNFTRFGRHVLAIGGNEEGARLAGIPVGRTLVTVYSMSGALAGLAGVFLAALSFSGSPSGAIGWELSAIAAVVVGGTLLTGGVGSVGSTLVGVLLLGLIFVTLNFERGQGTFQLNSYWENFIRGAFLLIVVVFQSRLARRIQVPA
jgi:ribose/xylose/arabinose/galactoside ABC-type transport system permease subunit